MALSNERTPAGGAGSGVPVAKPSAPGSLSGVAGQPPPLPSASPAAASSASRRRPGLPLLTLLLLLLLGAAALVILSRSRNDDPARLTGRAAAWGRRLWGYAVGSVGSAAAPAGGAERPPAPAAVSALRLPLERVKAVASQMVARTAGNMADWQGGAEATPSSRTPPAAPAPAEATVPVGSPLAAPAGADLKATVIWPEIVLTAVMGSGTKGVAHVNGEVIGTGEKSREGLLLKGVEEQRALFELGGEQRYVTVNGSRQHARQPAAVSRGRRR